MEHFNVQSPLRAPAVALYTLLVAALLRAGSTPAFAADDGPVTVQHSGERQGWHYETTATVAGDRLNLAETITREGPGGMKLQLVGTGVLENFIPLADIEIRAGSITKFDYVNKNVRGTLDFSWTASKAEKGLGTVAIPERVLTLPPLAEIPLDIDGLPFTLDIDSALFVDPGFSAAGQETHGHFTVKYTGDQGFRVVNGTTAPVGTIHGDVTIEPDTTSSSVLSPFGFIASIALPRLALRPGFVASSLTSENGKLADRARLLRDESGLRIGDELLKSPGLKPGGSYVELVLSGGEAQSGPSSLLPCEQTNLYFSIEGGGASALGAPAPGESKSFGLKELHRFDPPGKGCALAGVGAKTEQPQPAPSPKPCDLDATGSTSDFYGVPQGSNMRGFHDKKGPNHPGFDAQRLRGAQVFANLRDRIPLAELRRAKTEKGVAIAVAGTGDAELVEARVLVQPWDKPEPWMYGGVIGLTATYRYHDDAGAERKFRIYTEYLHLITSTHPPRDDQRAYVNAEGRLLKPGESYIGCSGFGSRMTNGTVLGAAELGNHPLIGFLGATISPHVHIEAWFAADPAITDRRVKPDGILFDPGVAVGGHP